MHIVKNDTDSLMLKTPLNALDKDKGPVYYINNQYPPNWSDFFSAVISLNSDGSVTFTFTQFKFDDSSDISSLYVDIQKNGTTQGQIGRATFSTVQSTPMFLGPMQVHGSSINFSAAQLLNAKVPVGNSELAPKLYVDTYIQNITTYFKNIVDNAQMTDVVDRLVALESQLDRLYQALYGQSVHRNAAAINAPDGQGSLVSLPYSDSVTQSTASDEQSALFANLPAPPSSLSF